MKSDIEYWKSKFDAETGLIEAFQCELDEARSEITSLERQLRTQTNKQDSTKASTDVKISSSVSSNESQTMVNIEGLKSSNRLELLEKLANQFALSHRCVVALQKLLSSQPSSCQCYGSQLKVSQIIL